MKLISKRENTYKQMIVAAVAFAVFLLPAFAPDARAADSNAQAEGSRWYFGLNVPVMFIDNSDSVESGAAQAQGAPLPSPIQGERPHGIRYGVQDQRRGGP